MDTNSASGTLAIIVLNPAVSTLKSRIRLWGRLPVVVLVRARRCLRASGVSSFCVVSFGFIILFPLIGQENKWILAGKNTFNLSLNALSRSVDLESIV